MSIDNLSETIKTKSDQLNADDLIGGSTDVLITGIRRGSADQPIIIDIAGHMPFKPCKTVRRILIKGWGDNGHEWVGKSLKLYNDPSVKWAGVAIGGIRVSHMSHITQPFEVTLNASAKHKMKHSIQPLQVECHKEVIAQYMALDSQDKKEAMWANLSEPQRIAIQNSINGVK